eukprot:6577105-Prymnesium_polylepis.1
MLRLDTGFATMKAERSSSFTSTETPEVPSYTVTLNSVWIASARAVVSEYERQLAHVTVGQRGSQEARSHAAHVGRSQAASRRRVVRADVLAEACGSPSAPEKRCRRCSHHNKGKVGRPREGIDKLA